VLQAELELAQTRTPSPPTSGPTAAVAPFEKLAADRLRTEPAPALGTEELPAELVEIRSCSQVVDGDLLAKVDLHSHQKNGYVNALLMCPADLDEACEGNFLPEDLTKGHLANEVKANGVMAKGVKANGLMANGVIANGVIANGVISNALMANGVKSNEVVANGLTANGSADLFCPV
jgi:hypothetical protein